MCSFIENSAGVRLAGAPSRLIIWRLLKPILFKLLQPRIRLVNLSERECGYL